MIVFVLINIEDLTVEVFSNKKSAENQWDAYHCNHAGYNLIETRIK